MYALQENKFGMGVELEGLEWAKFENSGKTELKLSTNITNSSSLKDKAFLKLNTSLEKQFNKTFSQVEGTSSTLDVRTDNSATYNIILTDQVESPKNITDNNGNIIGVSFVNGRTAKLGDTQNNTITISVTDAAGSKRPITSIVSTINHELGHAGGLSHPWLENKTNDIKNQKTNLMNSDANPNLQERSTGGKELTSGQIEIIKNKIK